MGAADSFGEGGADIEHVQLGAQSTLLGGNGVGVGDNNLVHVGALLDLAERVAAQNSVGGNDVHRLGTVVDQVVGSLQERVATIDHVILRKSRHKNS